MTDKTLRRILIGTGIPLAVASLGFGIIFGGWPAILAAMGMYTALHVADLLAERPMP